MAVAKVGTSKVVGSSGASFAVVFPQAPTAGNLLVLSIMGYRVSAAPTISTTDGTWVLANSGAPSNNGTTYCKVWVYYKVAAGGDTAPTFTTTASSFRYILEEWSGLATSSLVDSVSAVGESLVTQATGNCNVPALTTTNPADWVYTVMGQRTTAAPTAQTNTYGGGATSDVAPSNSSNSIATATETLSAAGTVNTTIAYAITGTTQVVSQAISVAFKQAGSTAVQKVQDGASTPSSFKVGTATASAIYLGSTKVVG